jgi:hypothetical protein
VTTLTSTTRARADTYRPHGTIDEALLPAGGGTPGSTTALSGTYDPTTGQFTMSWKSLIVGGPFNTFTGVWHLTGTFVPTS